MGANKIILNGKPLLDLTGDTVTEADVRIGVTFHKRNGEAAQGTYVAPQAPQTQEKSLNVTADGQYTVTPDSGYYLSKVNVTAKFEKPENRLAKYFNMAITDLTKDDLAGATTIPEKAFMRHTALKTVDIPDTVTSFGNAVFAYDNALTTVVSIGKPSALPKQLFYGCANLKSFEIPNTVTTIGNGAFQSCNSLGTVTIPASVKTIEALAFNNSATWLPDTFVMMGEIPPSIQSDSFNINAISQISLPKGSLAAYTAATNWAALASKFVERTS